MSEQIPVITDVPAATVPFYKNKRFLITAAAVTTALAVVSYLKLSSNDDDNAETDEISAPADTSSSKK
jgi:hypothetical protein